MEWIQSYSFVELSISWIVINEGVVSKSSMSLVYFAVSYRTRNRIFNLCGPYSKYNTFSVSGYNTTVVKLYNVASIYITLSYQAWKATSREFFFNTRGVLLSRYHMCIGVLWLNIIHSLIVIYIKQQLLC